MKRAASSILILTALALASAPALSKPISYPHGTSVMWELSPDQQEFQVLYTPSFKYSLGGGYVDQTEEMEGTDRSRHTTYVRANYLLKRWNTPSAQSNIFIWGGAGHAQDSLLGDQTVTHLGAQWDYETRVFYASAKFTHQSAPSFSQTQTQSQIGWSPKAHDYDTLATWVLLQHQQTTGDMPSKDTALLLRLFKKSNWVEVGVTTSGHPVAMLMKNF